MDSSATLLENIETWLLESSGGNEAQTRQLIELISSHPEPVFPTDVGKLLTDNLPLIIDDVTRVKQSQIHQELLLVLAAAGIDSMHVRDALAVLCRHLNASFPDPAGLIRALGIFDQTIKTAEIRRRWDVFHLLEEGGVAWHNSYGLGRIGEIDSFSDLVYVHFQTKQQFTLVQAMTTLFVARKSSFTATEFATELSNYKPNKSAAEFDAAIVNDFVPKLAQPYRITELLLVPYKMSKSSYAEWRADGQSPAAKSKAGERRQWYQSRSLEELTDSLSQMQSLKVSDQEIAAVGALVRADSVRPAARTTFADAMIALWALCRPAPWLKQLIQELPPVVAAWASREAFIENVCRLPAKRLPEWFEIALLGKGPEWFVDTITELPYRFWAAAETAMEESGFETDDLVEAACEKYRAKTATADAVLWLWRQRRDTVESLFSNPVVLFKILAKPAKGEFIKGRKEALKLLMDDPDFQRAFMDGGTDDGIAAFVKAVRNMPLLNKGEQQSLLVKIVRMYPHAEEVVEDRKKVVAHRPLPKVTSVRSFEERRIEFEQIVNERIPRNSAAIAHARSYGDLRENAEYKAAKEEQRLLMARRRELERALKDVQRTDFTNVAVFDIVIPGCTVELAFEGKSGQEFHILGLWDSVPDKYILSYDTPLGRALMGKKAGDSIETPDNIRAEIKSIRKLPPAILEWVAGAS